MIRFFPSTIRGDVFDPTSIGNCEIWFDASDDSTVTREGTVIQGPDTLDLIRTLNDKSGNSRNIEQPLEANRPAVSVETLNGRQLFQSISTGRFLWSQADFDLIDYPITMFCVSKQQLGVTCSYSFPTANNRRIMFNNLANTSGNFQVRSGAVTSNTPNSSLIPGDYYINEGIAESNILRKFSTNGGTYFDNIDSVTYPISTRFFLFRSSNQNPVGINDGFFGEVLMYSKVLTSGERTQVIDYLASKWGITI